MRPIDADALKTKVLKEGTSYILTVIDNAPTVEDRTKEVLSLQETIRKLIAARPTGKWIEIKSSCDIGHKFYHCSECNRFLDVMTADGETLEDYPFCHCGADMRGGIE